MRKKKHKKKVRTVHWIMKFKGIIFEELIQRWCFFCVIFYVCF